MTDVKQKSRIILISGKPNSGKDFTGEIIKRILESNGYKCVITHYADRLKQLLSTIFSIDLQYFYDRDLKNQQISDDIIATPRELMQTFGTDYCQKYYKNIWVDSIKDACDAYSDDYDFIIVPDLRFEHELLQNTFNYDVDHLHIIGPDEKVFRDDHIAENLNYSFNPDVILINNKNRNVDDLVINISNEYLSKIGLKCQLMNV